MPQTLTQDDLSSSTFTPVSTSMDVQQWQAAAWFQDLQEQIVAEIELIDGEIDHSDFEPAKCVYTEWQRKENDVDGDFGGGRFAVMRQGRVFEKAGVALANVKGNFSDTFAKEIPGCENDTAFTATGISLVFHPRNPYVPIVHMNTRFITTKGKRWFAGGADLTPVMPFDEDTVQFHMALKDACDVYKPGVYGEYKKWCDEYFEIKHRKETRGVGGIFYDYCYVDDDNFDALFAFTKDVGMAFLKTYAEIARRRYRMIYNGSETAAQLQKRARYTEFNLVYDRGIKFGLNTGGNIDAMFMSLPPTCGWE